MESLLYFHPAPEGMYQKNAARRHWWQDAGLMTRELPAKEREPFFLLVDCPVPLYYYKRQLWPPDVLSACMTETVHGARGMADAWLHPDIMTLMSEKYRKRWEAAPDMIGRLLACLLAVSAADCLRESGEATVLLGRAADTLWQMELTGQVLAPYLPRINRLTFYYEETAGVDLWEEAADSLEVYSYEYGLTPCLVPYRANGGKAAGGSAAAGGGSRMANRGSCGFFWTLVHPRADTAYRVWSGPSMWIWRGARQRSGNVLRKTDGFSMFRP